MASTYDELQHDAVNNNNNNTASTIGIATNGESIIIANGSGDFDTSPFSDRITSPLSITSSPHLSSVTSYDSDSVNNNPPPQPVVLNSKFNEPIIYTIKRNTDNVNNNHSGLFPLTTHTAHSGTPQSLPEILETIQKTDHFPKIRHRWNTNEEIAALLIAIDRHDDWLSKEVEPRPKSGSMMLYSRKRVRYRRDGYCWKKRKDGKTTREDHMKLKVQGIECIYGCYVHSAILPTFHRRCYWLLQNPDIVLVHYLNVPFIDDNKVVMPSLNLFSDSKKDWTRDDLIEELKPMFYNETDNELCDQLELTPLETIESVIQQLMLKQRAKLKALEESSIDAPISRSSTKLALNGLIAAPKDGQLYRNYKIPSDKLAANISTKRDNSTLCKTIPTHNTTTASQQDNSKVFQNNSTATTANTTPTQPATVQLLQLNSTNEICQLNSGTSVMNNSGNHISTPFILNWSQLQSGSSFFILNSPVSQNSKTSSAQISQTEPVTFVAYGRTDCGNGGTNLEDKKCVARNNLSSSINPNTTSVSAVNSVGMFETKHETENMMLDIEMDTSATDKHFSMEEEESMLINSDPSSPAEHIVNPTMGSATLSKPTLTDESSLDKFQSIFDNVSKNPLANSAGGIILASSYYSEINQTKVTFLNSNPNLGQDLNLNLLSQSRDEPQQSVGDGDLMSVSTHESFDTGHHIDFMDSDDIATSNEILFNLETFDMFGDFEHLVDDLQPSGQSSANGSSTTSSSNTANNQPTQQFPTTTSGESSSEHLYWPLVSGSDGRATSTTIVDYNANTPRAVGVSGGNVMPSVIALSNRNNGPLNVSSHKKCLVSTLLSVSGTNSEEGSTAQLINDPQTNLISSTINECSGNVVVDENGNPVAAADASPLPALIQTNDTNLLSHSNENRLLQQQQSNDAQNGGTAAFKEKSTCPNRGRSPTTTLATIADYSPEWCYPEGGIKVLVAGPWHDHGQYVILFDEEPVPTTLVQSGLLRCYSPKHEPGLVTLKVSTNGCIISNSVMFEYRAHSSPSTQSTDDYFTLDENLLKRSLLDRCDSQGGSTGSDSLIKQRLMDSNGNINSQNIAELEASLIEHFASQSGSPTCISHTEHSATTCQLSLLHIAVALKLTRLVSWLLEQRHSTRKLLLSTDKHGSTPVAWAVALGHYTMAKILLEYEPNAIHLRNRSGRTLLELAKDDRKMIALIKEAGGKHQKCISDSATASLLSDDHTRDRREESWTLDGPMGSTTSSNDTDNDDDEEDIKLLDELIVYLEQSEKFLDEDEAEFAKWNIEYRDTTHSSADSSQTSTYRNEHSPTESDCSTFSLRSLESLWQPFTDGGNVASKLNKLTITECEHQEMFRAARIIQKAYRKYKGRQKTEAAMIIQNYFRRYRHSTNQFDRKLFELKRFKKSPTIYENEDVDEGLYSSTATMNSAMSTSQSDDEEEMMARCFRLPKSEEVDDGIEDFNSDEEDSIQLLNKSNFRLNTNNKRSLTN